MVQEKPSQLTSPCRISIALCTYRGEDFIADQIASILNQTLPVHEIVLGDDSPDEGTIRIVESMLADSAIDLVIRPHRKALGVKDNFSDAISSTTGDVIFLCDQDDVWAPNKVERILPHLTEVELVHTDAELIDSEGLPLDTTLLRELRVRAWEKKNLENGDALAVLLKRNLVTGATTAVRGDFARAAMPVPDGWIHDEWLAMLAALDHSLRLLPETLTYYRRHANNQIGAQRESLLHRGLRLLAADPDDDQRRLIRALSAAEFVTRTQRGSGHDRARIAELAHHQRVRSLMPTGRLLRTPPILKEGVSGRYFRCSRGLLTLCRDILQVKESGAACTHTPEER